MKSPFPGMDPFIEACGLWGDFHSHLIEEIYRALADKVPPRYTVRSGERRYVVLESEALERRPFLPDVAIRSGRKGEIYEGTEPNIALAEPETDDAIMRAFNEEEYRETFVEVFDFSEGNRLVTSIEILSPVNKRPNTEGWNLYQRKRQALLQGGSANLVEIDLLHGGRRMPMVEPWPDSPYTVLTARIASAPLCKVRRVYFNKPAPEIAVPLLPPDSDVRILLQPMIDAIYARSHYDRDIDYAKPLTPPLSAEEAAWLSTQLKSPESGT